MRMTPCGVCFKSASVRPNLRYSFYNDVQTRKKQQILTMHNLRISDYVAALIMIKDIIRNSQYINVAAVNV